MILQIYRPSWVVYLFVLLAFVLLIEIPDEETLKSIFHVEDT